MKVLCVLYDDPADGYPRSYPRDALPALERYPDRQTLPTPSAIDTAMSSSDMSPPRPRPDRGVLPDSPGGHHVRRA